MNPKEVKKKVSVAKMLRTKYLRPKHHAYLRRWANKFPLEEDRFFLYVFSFNKKDNTEATVRFNAHGHNRHALGLSTAAFRQDSWKDAIVHELLHVLFYHARGKRPNCHNRLSVAGEESLVYVLARLLARGKH